LSGRRPGEGDVLRSDLKGLGDYGTVGLELVLSILVGFLGGRWLDGKLGTNGWLTVIGFVFGTVAGFRALYRAAVKMRKETEAEDEREQRAGDADGDDQGDGRGPA
jgi:F0F1-type ATP synthase assembly protein I